MKVFRRGDARYLGTTNGDTAVAVDVLMLAVSALTRDTSRPEQKGIRVRIGGWWSSPPSVARVGNLTDWTARTWRSL
ncbi:hypothetical protein EAO68_33975 [Streptomyces sp. wa22]|nr:hypothetical protein EAO68_33975 [Streptomyces sp. wa22]